MENHLTHLTEFQKVLADYHTSSSSKKILNDTKLALLVAPTSSGRNTIMRELVKTDEYHYIVSDTTRRPRKNDGVMEQNGVEYWFRSEGDILNDLRDGKFLEAAIIHNQQVSGISVRELKKAHEQHKVALTDIEIAGVETIIQQKPDTMAFFVLPPSFDEWQNRLTHRGHMSRAEMRRRMESALAELGHALEKPYYTFVINDTVQGALEKIHTCTMLGEVDPYQQNSAKIVAEQLYMSTKRYLDSN